MFGVLRSKASINVTRQAIVSISNVRHASSGTVGEILEDAVDRLPHKEAFRSLKQDIRWSFKELYGHVDELAQGFNAMHFAPGDTLAVWLPNNAEKFVTYLAAAKAGLTVADIDPEISTADEIEYILHDSKANGLMFEPTIAGRNQTELIRGIFPELATYHQETGLFRPKHFKNLHSIITTAKYYEEGMIHFRDIFVDGLDPRKKEAMIAAVSKTTPLYFTYTKANSGNPSKSSILTHEDVLKSSNEFASSLKLTNTDKILSIGKKSNAFSPAPYAAISTSSLYIIPSTEYDESAVKHAMELEACTIVGNGPTDYKRV